MKLLISGFTTFSTHTENSSQIIANRFKDTKIEGFEIRTVILPVSFSNSFESLKVEIDSFKPDAVICLGLASNRKEISLEKVAINLIHGEMADNEGVVQQDLPIMPEGPAAYFSTLPLQTMSEVQSPFAVKMSFSAGTYVCNYLIYRVMDYLKGTKVKAGFIHLPHLDGNEISIFNSLVAMLEPLKIKTSPIVLIDDDRLIHLNWSSHCKKIGVQFHGFKSIEQFIAFSAGIDKSARIYIDSNLEDGIKGEVESEKIFNLGFINLYLATSHHKDAIEKPSWIKEIYSKSPDHI